MVEGIFIQMLEQIRDSGVLSSRQRADMERLLESIGRKFGGLALADPDGARSAGNFLGCAIWESIRRDRTNPLATVGRKGMLLAFRPYEESHPELVAEAYTLGDVLSALGV